MWGNKLYQQRCVGMVVIRKFYRGEQIPHRVRDTKYSTKHENQAYVYKCLNCTSKGLELYSTQQIQATSLMTEKEKTN